MKQEIILFYGLSTKAENLQKQIEKIRKKGFYSSVTEGQGPCDIREYNNHFSSITYDHPKNPMNLEYLKDFSINWKKYISPFKDWWPLWSYYFQRTQDTEKNKEKEVIPSLIVRLRGKHSTKYLCSYSFTEVENNSEKIIAKDIITDYEKLLKKSSLKVRANENINFQFSTDPKEITVSIWNLDNKALTVKRGCIKVPDLEGKYVLIVKGNYKNGFVKYAVVLDIRK